MRWHFKAQSNTRAPAVRVVGERDRREQWGSAAGKPLPRIVSDWLAHYGLSGSATVRAYGTAVFTRALPHLAPYGSPRAIGPTEAEQVLGALRRLYAPATVAQTQSALSSLWRELVRQGEADENPWLHAHREQPKVTIAERVLSRDEVERLVRAAPAGPERILVRCLYLTGARVSEIVRPLGTPAASPRGLRWRDVRPDQAGWLVATLYGKGGRTRAVALPPSLVTSLRSLPGLHRPDDPVFPVSRVEAWRIVRRAARAGGLGKDVSPHWLRHAHALHSLEAGVPLNQLQATLGHKRLDTTGIYTQVAPGHGSAAYLDDVDVP